MCYYRRFEPGLGSAATGSAWAATQAVIPRRSGRVTGQWVAAVIITPPAFHRTSRPCRRGTSGYHHMHVYRASLRCWLWDCACGGGIHEANHGLSTQRSAFAAALDHASRSPGG